MPESMKLMDLKHSIITWHINLLKQRGFFPTTSQIQGKKTHRVRFEVQAEPGGRSISERTHDSGHGKDCSLFALNETNLKVW